MPALTGHALVMMTRGDHAHLASIADEMMRIGDEVGSDFLRFYGVMTQGFTRMIRGDLETGRRYMSEAKALYVDDHERRALRAGYPMWDCLCWWEGIGAWLAGDVAIIGAKDKDSAGSNAGAYQKTKALRYRTTKKYHRTQARLQRK